MAVTHPLPTEVARVVDALVAPAHAGRDVVFDADGTLWRGDVGEDLLRFLAAEGRLPGSPESPFARYEALVEVDPARAYAYAVQVMAGAPDAEVAGWCQDFYTRRYAGRVFPWVAPLITRLDQAGLQVWICSASPRWAVEPGARALGVPLERVIGVDAELADGRLTTQVKQPVPCGEGKVTWLQRKGVAPLLAFGNGDLDLPMLSLAEHAVVVAPHGGPDNTLVAAAQTRGWPVLRC